MRNQQPWRVLGGLFWYAVGVWAVLVCVVLLIAWTGLRDVQAISNTAGGTFLWIGVPIFVLGLGVPILLLKALSRWSRDIEGDDSRFRIRDIPDDESPHPVSSAPPQSSSQSSTQSGERPPVASPRPRSQKRQRI